MDKEGKIKDVLKSSWSYLAGRPSEFPLESRIYHSFCIIAIIAIFYHIPFNYAVGLPYSSLIAAVLLITQSYLYYLARFRGKLTLSLVISGVIINALFAINYFVNSGVDGPTFLLFIVEFFLIVCVAPPKQYHWWFGLNIILVFGLLLVEYLHPELIINNYGTRFDRFIDTASAYTVVMVLVYFGTAFLVSNYKREKRLTEEKAIELEALNSGKNRLFSIISHDIRAPLSSIQTFLELLLEVELEPEDRIEIKKDLLTQTRHTQEMLLNLLSWSKTQMDGTLTNLTSLNLKTTLSKTLELSRMVAVKKEITLIQNLPDTISVVADKDMLELIIRNLLNNAVKFTGKGGEVEISARLVKETCEIMVRDTGIGIEPEMQKRLFSLGSRSSYGTENEKGIGLGLVLCKDYTEIQNGRIWFVTEPGAGTTFFVSFQSGPAIKQEQHDPAEKTGLIV